MAVNGAAFANLPQLVEVDLRFNVCINKFLEIGRGSKTFSRKFFRHCVSADVVNKQITCRTSIFCFESRFDYSSGCCGLEYGTFIDGPDYTFAGDTNYTGIDFLIIKHQENVELLPVSVHQSFPFLKYYFVVNTPVQKVTKKYFEKMYKLERLKLDRNQIEVIKSDTFEDLVNLWMIEISTILGSVFIQILFTNFI